MTGRSKAMRPCEPRTWDSLACYVPVSDPVYSAMDVLKLPAEELGALRAHKCQAALQGGSSGTAGFELLAGSDRRPKTALHGLDARPSCRAGPLALASDPCTAQQCRAAHRGLWAVLQHPGEGVELGKVSVCDQQRRHRPPSRQHPGHW